LHYLTVVKVKDAKQEIEKLRGLTFYASSGAVVLLSDICEVTVEQGASFIKRQNLNRYMVVGKRGK